MQTGAPAATAGVTAAVSVHERRLDRLTALRRQRALLDHDETVLLAAIAADPQPWPGDLLANDKDWVREEVAALLLLSPVTAGSRLHTAEQLVTRFPATVELMSHGDLPGQYGSRLVDLTSNLSEKNAALVEARVLPRAPRQTISQFAASVRRAVLAVDPATAEQKHARARADRRVVFNPPGEDGMVELWALLPADQAAELRARIDAQAQDWKRLDRAAARAARAAAHGLGHGTDRAIDRGIDHGLDGGPDHGDDPVRTMDQLRADALCALGADTAPLSPRVNVTVSLATLLGLDDQPGEIDGHPVTAAIARTLAFDPTGRWRRLLVDDGGRLIDISTDSYTPPAPMSRFVKTRDRTCQFSTCQRRAMRCEDHHLWSWFFGGPTSPRNLIALCSRHHHLRHDAGWTLTRDPDGTAVWTSPTGRVYKRPPPEPPPF